MKSGENREPLSYPKSTFFPLPPPRPPNRIQYHANQLLALSDAQVVDKVMGYLAQCIPQFGEAKVTDRAVVRFRRAVTHFFPGECGWENGVWNGGDGSGGRW